MFGLFRSMYFKEIKILRYTSIDDICDATANYKIIDSWYSNIGRKITVLFQKWIAVRFLKYSFTISRD